MDNPSAPPDKWRSGGAYDQYMGRWSRQVAPRFLDWLAAPPGLRWLDVGCGTGALCDAIASLAAPRSVTGIEPSRGFLDTARGLLGDAVALHEGTAAAIPLPDGAADVTVSGLVLNFVPDADAALRDMARVTARGGALAVYVWDYAQKMDLIRHYWDAAARLDPQAARQDQGERFPLCRPEALQAAFDRAGLVDVEVSGIEIPMRFVDFDDYWRPFLGGQGPAPAHAMSLDGPTRERLRELLRASLPVGADGSIELGARAWAARGRVVR